MRQLNIAQRSANVFASVRNSAFVAGNEVRLLLQHLLHALQGMPISSTCYQRHDWISKGMNWFGRSLVLIPVTYPTPKPKATKRRG